MVSLAAKAKFAFHLIRLGVLGIVDLERARSLDQNISIRGVRPLALFASEDGRHVALAYESGEAEVLELVWSGRELINQRTIASLEYLLTEFESPAMCWAGNRLIYQNVDGGIGGFDMASGQRTNLMAASRSDPPAELRSVTAIKQDLILGMSSVSGVRLLLQGNGHDTQICEVDNSDIVSICACDASIVAVAFSNHEIRTFGIAGKATELSRATLKELPTCMAYRGETLVVATDSDELYTWRCSQGSGPVMVQSGHQKLVSRIVRSMAFADDGTLLLISQSRAEVRRIVQGNDNGGATILGLFATSHHAYAITQRDQNVLLVKLDTGIRTPVDG